MNVRPAIRCRGNGPKCNSRLNIFILCRIAVYRVECPVPLGLGFEIEQEFFNSPTPTPTSRRKYSVFQRKTSWRDLTTELRYMLAHNQPCDTQNDFSALKAFPLLPTMKQQ